MSFVIYWNNDDLIGKSDFHFFPYCAQHPDLSSSGLAYLEPVPTDDYKDSRPTMIIGAEYERVYETYKV